MDHAPTRPGEVIGGAPARADAFVTFIGRLRTPFPTRADCPRQGAIDGPECRIEVDEAWRPALAGLAAYPLVEVLYWMHHARRDLLVQAPGSDGATHGTFALRSPVRPNPIATAIVAVVSVEPDALVVRGLDCLDGTPLLDIKPHRDLFRPKAAPKAAAAGGG